jgi:hypothetical protein
MTSRNVPVTAGMEHRAYADRLSVMRRIATPYAIIGSAVAVAGAAAAIALRIVDPVPLLPGTFGFGVAALGGLELLGVTFALVGGLLVVRVPGNAVGWCMVLIGYGYALGGLAAAITGSAVADGPAGAATAAFAGWLTVFFTTIGGLVFGLGFIFPTGRGHTPAWDRAVRIGAVVSPFLFTILFLIRPGPLHLFPTMDNPFGVGPDLRPFFGPQVSRSIAAGVGAVVPLLAWSLASRYRQADAIGRQQLKWFVLALLVTIGGVGAAALGAMVSEEPPEAGLVVFGYAGALVPVAIGIAILRYRLYDIDRLISRSVSYTLVTGVLAAVFAATAVGLSTLLSSLAQGQSLAVAASTLIVLGLFGPLRRRAQAIVDRRFDRSLYDASVTLQAMSARLRDDVDLERVQADVLGVVDRTFHPTHAGLWLREAKP